MFWWYFIYKNNLRKKRKKCFIDFNNAIFVSHPILTIDMSKPLRITNHIGCILWDFTNLHCCRVETKNWSISAFGFLQKSNSDMKYIDALEKWRNGSIGMGSPDPRFSKIACSSFLISAFSTKMKCSKNSNKCDVLLFPFLDNNSDYLQKSWEISGSSFKCLFVHSCPLFIVVESIGIDYRSRV